MVGSDEQRWEEANETALLEVIFGFLSPLRRPETLKSVTEWSEFELLYYILEIQIQIQTLNWLSTATQLGMC